MLGRQEQHHQTKVARTASKQQSNPINGEGKYGLIPTKKLRAKSEGVRGEKRKGERKGLANALNGG
jgi:hypothetical protein